MAYIQQPHGQDYPQAPHQEKGPQLARLVGKATTAVTMGGSLAVLSGLTLAATVIGLVLATPLLVIFSPVLVPAALITFLIAAGFLTAGGFGATASFIFYWMYSYVTGKKPIGAEQLDRVRERISLAARGMKDKALQPQMRGIHEST